MNLISEQRYLLLKRLDVLSEKLNKESDSLRAELILQEMRDIGALLIELVGKRVPDHEFINNANFKKYGAARRSTIKE